MQLLSLRSTVQVRLDYPDVYPDIMAGYLHTPPAHSPSKCLQPVNSFADCGEPTIWEDDEPVIDPLGGCVDIFTPPEHHDAQQPDLMRGKR